MLSSRWHSSVDEPIFHQDGSIKRLWLRLPSDDVLAKMVKETIEMRAIDIYLVSILVTHGN